MPQIEQVLTQMCDNPLHSKVTALLSDADECLADLKDNAGNTNAFRKFRTEIIRLHDAVCRITVVTGDDAEEISAAFARLEMINKESCVITGFTYAPLEEIKQLQL
jgi:hypothetical protein